MQEVGATQEGISVLIPVYNEERAVAQTIEAIKKTLSGAGIAFEIIAVNDGSTDGSGGILSQVPGIHCIHHRRNKGYGASLRTGLRAAKFADICITDADGTYPVDRMPDLHAAMRKDELDMIVGSRNGKNVSYPLLKKIPKFFIKHFAQYIAGTEIPDINSGFRIFKRDVALKFFTLYPDGFSFTTTITMSMLCRGYEVDFMPIDYFKREGHSKIAPIKDTAGFFILLAKLAVFFNPMKFFFPLALVFGAAAAGMVARDLVHHNLSDSSVLLPLIAALVLFVGLIADSISRK